jgi:hypothetical protein
MAMEALAAPTIGLQVAGTVSEVSLRNLRLESTAVGTVGPVIIATGGSVGSLSVSGAHLLMSSSVPVIQTQASVTTGSVHISDVYMGGTATGSLLLATSSGNPAMQVVLTDITLAGAGYLIDCESAMDVLATGLNLQTLHSGQVIWLGNSGSVLTLQASGLLNPGSVPMFGFGAGAPVPSFSNQVSRAVIPSFPQTYTGGVIAQTILAGPTITPTAGQVWEWVVWARMTTTLAAQTVSFNAQIDGYGILGIGGIQPNPGGTITTAATQFRGRVIFTDATHYTSAGELYLNYYLSNMSEQASTAFVPPGPLAVQWTPSAAAMTLIVDGGYWNRIA